MISGECSQDHWSSGKIKLHVVVPEVRVRLMVLNFS